MVKGVFSLPWHIDRLGKILLSEKFEMDIEKWLQANYQIKWNIKYGM